MCHMNGLSTVLTDLSHSGLLLSVASSGIRGPSKNSKAFNSQLESKQLKAAGAMDNPHGTWLYASHLSDPGYVMTLSAQNRYVNPGLALISYPRTHRSSNAQAGIATVPGTFQPWASAPGPAAAPNAAASGVQLFSRVLVAPGSPARPLLTQQPAGVKAAGSDGASVLTVSWSLPAGSPAVDQFRLFVAADPMFVDLIRQPAGDAFGPPDIPGGTRSVDVVIGSRLAGGEVYVLLLACNDESCRTSCVQQVVLSQHQPAVRPS
jgi:hypothetical protein